MKKWTLKYVEREVKRLDPKVDGETFKVAVLVLSAAVVGPKIPELRKFTGYGREFIVGPVNRLRESGVFTKDHKLAVDWFKKDGGISFWLDVAVACGWLARAKGGA